MGAKLTNISIDMSIIKKLCKINEYKGEQVIYKRQPKNMVNLMMDNAIIKFVYDTYIDNFTGGKEKLVKLINNEIKPQSREEIGVVEFRDVIKTVNSAYEDINVCSQTILELHGYLHRYSLIRGGRYRNEALKYLDIDYNYKNLDNFNNYLNQDFNIEEIIGNKVENLCNKYYEFLNEDKIQDLIIIASFIMDFMIISPFNEDNLSMAKILTILLLNKCGYEIARFTSLGNLYYDENYIYFKNLFDKEGDFEKDSYNMNKWLDYFLSFILLAYENLTDEMNLIGGKKETKTRRIEKVINSTLGYFTKDDVRDQCPDIPEPTINRVFNNLRKSGKIEVVAKGRSAKWKKR